VLAELFAPENPVVEVADEAAFNMHFAVCAFLPGLLDLSATASEWLAGHTGDPDGAERYVRQLVAGFLHSLPDGKRGTLAAERDALATEGTLSLQMTDGLRRAAVHEALQDVLNSIGDRLEGKG
jgi:pyrroline-5-carboxylate reductase